MNKSPIHHTIFERLLVLLSLLVCLGYAFSAMLIPDVGFGISPTLYGWRVTNARCDCPLEDGDLLREVNGIAPNGGTRHLYLYGRITDTIPVLDAHRETVLVPFPPMSLPHRTSSGLFVLLLSFPFLLAAYLAVGRNRTAVLVFSLFAVIVASGMVSHSQIAYSSIVLHAAVWMAPPFTLLLYAKPQPPPLWAWALGVFCFAMALAEIAQLVGDSAYLIPLALFAVGVPVLLLLRSREGDRSSLIVLTGFAVAIAPSLVWIVGGSFKEIQLQHAITASAAIALALWPLHHIYAYTPLFQSPCNRKWRFRQKETLILMGYFALILPVFSFVYIVNEWGTVSKSVLLSLLAVTAVTVYPIYHRTINRVLSREPNIDAWLSQLIASRLIPTSPANIAALLDEAPELCYTFAHGPVVYGRVCEEAWPTIESGGQPVGKLGMVHMSSEEYAYCEYLAYLVGLWLDACTSQEVLNREMESAEELVAQIVQQHKLTALGQMAAGLSHELNTPLAAISLNLDMVTKDLKMLPPPIRREYIIGEDRIEEGVAAALRETRRMADLMKRIRSFSQPSSDTERMLDLNEAVNEAAALCRQAMPSGIAIVTEMNAGRINVIASQTLMSQVFINLINNAAEAVSGKPDGRITISTRNEGDMAVIEVADNGCGIDPRHLHRLGEMFFTTKEKGTGMGLYYCFQYITQYGGQITVQSELGQGSRFFVRIPNILAGYHR
jgi:nitrogen-specific signal transduction histidine kinase